VHLDLGKGRRDSQVGDYNAKDGTSFMAADKELGNKWRQFRLDYA
jgi:hypothetical protein